MIDDYLLFLNDFYARIEQIIMQKNTDIAFNLSRSGFHLALAT